MRITLNGETTELKTALTVEQLLAEHDLATNKVAVERNLEIVHAIDFGNIVLEDGDNIEIVHFIGGG